MNGERLTLAPSGWTYKNTFVLYDKESKSLWYPEGKSLKAIEGKHLGRTLQEVSHMDTSWSSWRKANPESVLAD